MPRLLWVLLLFLSACLAEKATFLAEQTLVEDVKIQPKEALSLASPHLAAHGTVVWQDPNNLNTHILKKGKYYFIKRSDFPAKSANWYLNNCIRIDAQTGEMTFLD